MGKAVGNGNRVGGRRRKARKRGMRFAVVWETGLDSEAVSERGCTPSILSFSYIFGRKSKTHAHSALAQ